MALHKHTGAEKRAIEKKRAAKKPRSKKAKSMRVKPTGALRAR